MPRYDGTGPMGMGPMTGNGKGYCIVLLDDSNRFDNANRVDNYMPTPNSYSNGDFRRRRSFPFKIIGRGRGRGCVHRRGLWQ